MTKLGHLLQSYDFVCPIFEIAKQQLLQFSYLMSLIGLYNKFFLSCDS